MGYDGPWDSLCLRGLNGSGRTTRLEAVGHVRQWSRRSSTRIRYIDSEAMSLLHKAGLITVLFRDLPGQRSRMWVAWGRQPELLPDRRQRWVFAPLAQGVPAERRPARWTEPPRSSTLTSTGPVTDPATTDPPGVFEPEEMISQPVRPEPPPSPP